MEFTHKINNVAISPRKIREVVRLIKNRPIEALRDELSLLDKSVSQILVKGIKAAEDRIKNVAQDPNEYLIKRINCNEGLKLKRRFFGSRGRSYAFIKQRSNIHIIIGQKLKPEMGRIVQKTEAAKEINNIKSD